MDGLDSARRAGWAKAYALNQREAKAAAVAALLASVIALDTPISWREKVASAVYALLDAPSDLNRDEWRSSFTETVAAIQCGLPFHNPVGWPTSHGRCA